MPWFPRKLAALLRRKFARAEHIRITEVENSVDECLRQLERSAGLPVGDLSIEGEPSETMAWPAMREGLTYNIVSATSKRWRADPNTDGYIAGSVFETKGPSTLTEEQLGRMMPIAAAAVSINHICVGNLHVSENCPGVYQDNRCTSCGDISR